MDSHRTLISHHTVQHNSYYLISCLIDRFDRPISVNNYLLHFTSTLDLSQYSILLISTIFQIENIRINIRKTQLSIWVTLFFRRGCGLVFFPPHGGRGWHRCGNSSMHRDPWLRLPRPMAGSMCFAASKVGKLWHLWKTPIGKSSFFIAKSSFLIGKSPF